MPHHGGASDLEGLTQMEITVLRNSSLTDGRISIVSVYGGIVAPDIRGAAHSHN
jgi:hypothetical protein